MSRIELLNKTYDGESIYDLTRDVAETFDGDFTPAFKAIPVDEYGIQKGRFVVNIQWEPSDG